MFRFVWDFLTNRQTFVSGMGDALGVVAVVASSPEAQAAIAGAFAGPWAPLIAAVGAYVAGSMGRSRKQTA